MDSNKLINDLKVGDVLYIKKLQNEYREPDEYIEKYVITAIDKDNIGVYGDNKYRIYIVSYPFGEESINFIDADKSNIFECTLVNHDSCKCIIGEVTNLTDDNTFDFYYISKDEDCIKDIIQEMMNKTMNYYKNRIEFLNSKIKNIQKSCSFKSNKERIKEGNEIFTKIFNIKINDE